jgi:hypothetical protein
LGGEIFTVAARRKWLAFTLLLALHYATTWTALLYMNHWGWQRFDIGGVPSIAEDVVGAVLSTLSFPITYLVFRPALAPFVAQLLPGLWGHIPFLLNSALWAGAIVWLVPRIASNKKAKPSQLAA